MLQDIVRNLIGIYRQDLLDYQKIVEKMDRFYQNSLSMDANSQNGTQISTIGHPVRDESPGRQFSSQEEDELVQKLDEISSYREGILTTIKARKVTAEELQRVICVETGISEFEASRLKPYLEETLFSELQHLPGMIRQEIGKILKTDELVLPRLKIEIEAVKLELHRIQSAKRTKNAYENQGHKEARFIDKNK